MLNPGRKEPVTGALLPCGQYLPLSKAGQLVQQCRSGSEAARTQLLSAFSMVHTLGIWNNFKLLGEFNRISVGYNWKEKMMIYGSNHELSLLFIFYSLAMLKEFAWKSVLVTLLTLMAVSVLKMH